MKKTIFILLLLISGAASAQKPPQRPNIVIIISDDHAMSAIGAYGATYGATPNIDRLAKQGALFTNAFVTNSICAPSRAVLLTGKYSHMNGLKDNHDEFNAAQDVFPRRLQHADFQTAWIGKWHLKTYPQGFDYWNIVPGQGQYYNPSFISMQGDTSKIHGYCTDVITDLTLKWLDGRDKAKPFCIVVGEKAPHRPWMPDTGDLGKYDHVNFPLPANFYDTYEGRIAAKNQDMNIAHTMKIGYDLKMQSDTDKVMTASMFTTRMDKAQLKKWNSYYKGIEDDFLKRKLTGRALIEWKYQRYMKDYLSTTLSMDRNIGKILAYLDQQHLSKNTIVVYTSDQGFYMGEHGWFDKRFMYEESLHTPLVIRYPGVIKPGTVLPQMVSNVDFAPTFLQATGTPIPAEIQGQSFLPILKNPAAKGRTSVYYHYYEYPAEHSVMKHFGIRTTRYKLIRFYGEKNFWELYDLKTDSHEMTNLYGRKAYDAIVTDLKKQLKTLTEQNKDDEALSILAQN